MKGNFIINDKTSNFMKLSLSAYYKLDTITLGVYCKLLGLGENWEMIPKALPSVLNLSKDKTIASIKTLEREGFLQRVAAKDVHGKFVGYIYRLNAEPAPAEERTRAGLGYVNSGLSENGVVQKPSTPKTGYPENPQPNNKENNIKYKDFNKDNKDNNKDYSSPSTRVREEKEFDEKYFVEKFNEVLASIQNVHPVRCRRLEGLSPERKEQVEYLSEKYGDEYFWNVIIKAFQSQFLNQKESSFTYDLDWIINESRFLMIAEDKYKELHDNKPNNNGRADIGLAGKTANERVETLQERIRRENDDFLNGKGEDRGLYESIF